MWTQIDREVAPPHNPSVNLRELARGWTIFFARFDLCGIRATTRVLNSIGRVADF